MNISKELLERFISGECTEQERRLVLDWLSSQESVKIDFSEEQIQESEDRVKRLLAKSISKQSTSKPGKRKLSSPWVFGIAASLALVAGLTFITFSNTGHTIYSTEAGTTKKIVLSDGSKVTLNALSTLTVTDNFGKETRNMQLTGEAFFEVAKDSLHPFIVKTGESKTQVLGTQFNLSAYEDEPTVLTLNEGKVSFSGQNNQSDTTFVVQPNEQVQVFDGLWTKREVMAQDYNLWIQKKLNFNQEAFSLIIKEIERFYDINILVEADAQGLLEMTYSGQFDNPPLEILLEDLGFVLNFNYIKEGKTVKIHTPGTNP